MAMTVMMVPISQGVAAMANGLPNKSFPGMSLIVPSTRSIFRFEEDKKGHTIIYQSQFLRLTPRNLPSEML